MHTIFQRCELQNRLSRRAFLWVCEPAEAHRVRATHAQQWLCVFSEWFPGHHRHPAHTVYKTVTRGHLGCIRQRCSAEGLFLGAFNVLAFIIGRVKCIARIPKLIFISRKKPIKINNLPGGKKRKEFSTLGNLLKKERSLEEQSNLNI